MSDMAGSDPSVTASEKPNVLIIGGLGMIYIYTQARF